MLILFTMFLSIAVALILIIRRNRETVYLLLLCLSLALFLFGIMLYIAKKGGINRELQSFLFLSDGIKYRLQYFLITLDWLGMIIALGRILFPAVVMLIALEFSMIQFIRNNTKLKMLSLILPVSTLIGYHPIVFRYLSNEIPYYQRFMVTSSYAWIMGYIVIALALLVYEYKSFKFIFWKRYLLYITIFIASLSIIFSLYARQDPSQVYFFNRDSYLYLGGVYYMNSALSVETYLFIVAMNVTFAIIGLFSFVQYTRSRIRNNREALLMKRNFDMASIGVSAFVHSTKNQLLTNRVLYKRLKMDLESEDVQQEKVQGHLYAMNAINENLLQRMEELHKSVKTRTVHMVPVSSKVLFDKALHLFSDKYGDQSVQIEGENIEMLVDPGLITEVIYNLLSNAQDAVQLRYKDKDAGKIILRSYQERIYSVLEITDNGMGMTQEQRNRVFEPFYSSKNSNFNWGMGLHYSREIVKGHYGTIRFDTEEGIGTTFYVLLPRY